MPGRIVGNSTIDIHFEEVMRLAEEILDVSNQMQVIYQDTLFPISVSINVMWNSENAEAFSRKVVGVASQLEEEAENIQKMAEDLKNHAQKIYRAETFNRTLAENRWYL